MRRPRLATPSRRPSKRMTAKSPVWTPRSSTGTRLACWSRSCSTTASTRASSGSSTCGREREVRCSRPARPPGGRARSPGTRRRSPSSNADPLGRRGQLQDVEAFLAHGVHDAALVEVLAGVVVDRVGCVGVGRGRCPGRARASGAAPCPGGSRARGCARDWWRTASSMARWSCSAVDLDLEHHGAAVGGGGRDLHGRGFRRLCDMDGRVYGRMGARRMARRASPRGRPRRRPTLRPAREWWNGRHAGLRSQCREAWGFESPLPHQPVAGQPARPRVPRRATWPAGRRGFRPRSAANSRSTSIRAPTVPRGPTRAS